MGCCLWLIMVAYGHKHLSTDYHLSTDHLLHNHVSTDYHFIDCSQGDRAEGVAVGASDAVHIVGQFQGEGTFFGDPLEVVDNPSPPPPHPNSNLTVHSQQPYPNPHPSPC